MSGSEKLFSIVTPTLGRNAAAALQRCLASVADQAGVEVEHIVQEQAGESGPTRESADVPGGRRWWIEADTGIYDALNRGFARATGAIYGRLNHDEQYLPDTLRWVADYFSTHPDVDLLFDDFLVVDKAGCLLAFRKGHTPRWLYIMSSHLYVFSCALFFRRRIWDADLRFDGTFKCTGDMIFVADALRRGFRGRHAVAAVPGRANEVIQSVMYLPDPVCPRGASMTGGHV